MKRILACLFSYSRDLELAVMATESALRAGIDLVAVLVDAASPFEETAFLPLISEDLRPRVTFRLTTFPRNRNLNGEVCVKAMHAVMKKEADEAGADWIVKLDSDAFVLPPLVKDLRDIEPGKAGLLGFISSTDPRPWRLYGCCYAYPTDMSDMIQKTLADWFAQPMAHNKHLIPGFGEDVVLASACEAGSIPRLYADIAQPATQFWLRPYDYAGEPVWTATTRCWNTGNVNVIPNLSNLPADARRLLELNAARKFMALAYAYEPKTETV